jgi:hypothetical protein
MTSRLFLSLTAFSLVLGCPAFTDEFLADNEVVGGQEVSVSEEVDEGEKNAEKRLLPKRMKPHFAGVKRPAVSALGEAEKQKKPRKMKNQWFSSKTQPKNEKKVVVENKETAAELPSDRPYFRRVSHSITASSGAQTNQSNKHSTSPSTSSSLETEGQKYPKTGFQAPHGHIYLTAEWLFWTARQEGMEFATSRQIKFDFESGFRVGLGTHLPSFDGWNIYVNYTRFNPEHSHSAHGSFYPLFLFQGAGAGGSAVTKAHGHWEIEFQNLDVEFGKVYYLTKTLIASPFFGFKGAWIDQHAHFRYEGGYIPEGQTFRAHFKNDFKGAGPLLGTEINWQLGAGFSLFGDAAAALIAGHFDNKQRQHQLDGVEVVHLADDFNLISPMIQMVLGAAWDRNFNRDKCHFGLSAGFEAQYWGNQNQTEQFTDDVRPTYVRQRGALSFYGLTLRGRLDF